MRSIVLASLKFRVLIAAAAIAVLAVGALQIRKMPVEVLPDFTPTTVEVQTEALGLSAAEVEQLITVPIEQDLLNGVAFVRDIQSESVPGLSRILMVFQPGTDVFKARQVVAERLTQTAALPQVSKPPRMLQPLSSTNRVLVVGMSSKTLSLMQLGVLARWTIAPRLVGVRGVSNISIWGQEDRQLQVQVDPKRLHAKGVGLDQVIETSANALWVSPLTFVEASTPGTGGFIDTANQRLGIQHESPIKTPADLAKVRVEGTKGRDLTLGDISTVTESHQPLIGQAVVNGRPGLLLVVQRLPGTNVLDVTRNLERTLDDMKPGLAGIEFDTSVYRPATYIETSIDNVRLAALAALALLALAFLALLFRWRTAVIGLVVVPLSVVSAALVLWAFGATMNAIVLTGLVAALVIVIDDAVVSIDSTTRELGRRAPGDSPESAEKAVLRAVLGVSRPTLYATLIIGLSVVPVFFLTRTSGAFFPDLAAAYLLALVVSFVVALAVAPALSLLLLSRGGPDQAPPIVRRLQGRYEAALSRIVGRSAVAYVAILALVALGGASIFLLGRSMLPTFHESQLLVRWDGPAAASLPEMNRITARASRELRAVPGVRGVGGHLGRAVTGDQIVGASSGELWVNVDPGANYDSTVAAVKRVAAEYPGLADRVETYSQAQTDAALGGTGSDLVVRVYGENLHTLGRQAGRVRQLMSGIDGVAGAHVLLPREEPTIQVRVDIDRADRYGLKPGDIRRSATTLLSGLVVGSLFEQE
jgi:Cu/Ag efflux pump CusA